MAGDHPVPVERQHSVERVEEVGQEAVGEVAELEALDGDEVHREEQLLLRQQHHQRVVRVVPAHVVQLEPRATELDGVEGSGPMSGMTTSGFLSASRRVFAFMCAMNVAPASLKGLPTSM